MLIIQGGSDKNNFFSDIWAFDVENNEWIEWTPQPSLNFEIEPRRDHAGTVFNGKFLIYGGKEKNGQFCQPNWKYLDLEVVCGSVKDVIQFSSYKRSGNLLTFGFGGKFFFFKMNIKKTTLFFLLNLGHGALGNFTESKQDFRSTPKIVTLEGKRNNVIKIGCSGGHTIALTNEGTVFTFGNAKTKDQSTQKPTKVSGLLNEFVCEVSLCSLYSVVIVEDPKTGIPSDAYFWGESAGFSNEFSDTKSIKLIKSLKGRSIISISSTTLETIVVTDKQIVYSWSIQYPNKLKLVDMKNQM